MVIIRTLRRDDPQIERNIFRSVQDVNLATILEYHRGEERHSFLDGYDRCCETDGETDGDVGQNEG